MSIISWNCWGLGNPNAVPSLRDLVRTYQLDVLFLCETLVQASQIDDIRVRLGFDSSFAVSSMGRSGGLAVFWKQPFDCHLISYSQNFINLRVCQLDSPDWRLTCFYGYPDSGRRRVSWELLRTLAMDNSLLWCIIGDFNDLLSNDDKRGRVEHPLWKIRGFREAVMDSHLLDIPIEGYQFTWTKGRGTDDFKEERLDRAMATQPWKDTFPNHRLCNSVVDRSDHTPIVLHLFAQRRRRRGRGFKFENAWLEEEQLEDVVAKGWALGEGLDVLNRLKTCTEEMNVWGRSLPMRYRTDIDNCRKEMEALREDVSPVACARYKEVQAKLAQLLHQEEAFWRQRSKVLWLKEGDSNSKFFHAAVSSRRRRNEIKKLMRDDGSEATTQAELQDTAREYFENLFQHAPINHQSVIDSIPSLLTDGDNALLVQPLVMEEFSQALSEMHKDKAPGPDGLNPGFYKRFWHLCGEEVFHASQSWLQQWAAENESRVMKDILHTYELASGQAMNLQKSEIFFSKNTPEDMRVLVSTLLGAPESLGTGKYLGLPSMIGRKKKAIFNYLRDRVWHKIQGWSGKHLSKAGREVMVKAVAQAIPSYCMSTFLIPTSLGEELERMVNSFWWGSNRSQGRGINWLRWDKLAMRKEFGGLGFQHFHTFNLAMLGKQGWKLLTNQDAIISRVFKAKYFPRGDFLGASLGHNPSFIWRSIYASQVLVKEGVRWRVGDGSNIRIWEDPWLRNSTNAYVTSPKPPNTHLSFVSDLIDDTSESWNIPLINASFTPIDAKSILSIPRSLALHEDQMAWKLSRDGRYSVKSAYYHAMEHIRNFSHLKVKGNWNNIWSLKIPHKLKIFIWRIARGCLPTRSRLNRRGVLCHDSCPMCNDASESERHLFFDCPSARDVWQQAGRLNLILEHLQVTQGASDMIFLLLEKLNSEAIIDTTAILWCLWKRRNDLIWKDVRKPVLGSVHEARTWVAEWRSFHADRQQQQRAPAGVRDGWQKPSVGRLKCNIDGAIFDHDNRCGIGVCVRDHTGSFLAAKTMWIEGSLSPPEIEALDLLEALRWLPLLGLDNIDIELDCKQVVDAVKGKLRLPTEFGVLVSTCRDTLLNFYNYSLNFVRRQANCVAHTLARAAQSFASHHVHHSIPSCISIILINEMA